MHKARWHRHYYNGIVSYEWEVWSITKTSTGAWEAMDNRDGTIWGPFDLLSNAKRHCVEQGEGYDRPTR